MDHASHTIPNAAVASAYVLDLVRHEGFHNILVYKRALNQGVHEPKFLDTSVNAAGSVCFNALCACGCKSRMISFNTA